MQICVAESEVVRVRLVKYVIHWIRKWVRRTVNERRALPKKGYILTWKGQRSFYGAEIPMTIDENDICSICSSRGCVLLVLQLLYSSKTQIKLSKHVVLCIWSDKMHFHLMDFCFRNSQSSNEKHTFFVFGKKRCFTHAKRWNVHFIWFKGTFEVIIDEIILINEICNYFKLRRDTVCNWTSRSQKKKQNKKTLFNINWQ